MTKSSSKSVILKTESLSKHYFHKLSLFRKPQVINAVKNLNLEIFHGESFGLIGESGSGKTTLAKLLLRLIEPSEGSIEFLGETISNYPIDGMREIRKSLQIIFQSGNLVLDPKRTIEELLREALILHNIVSRQHVESEVIRLLDQVGLSAADRYKRIGQMSGGQVQRALIARTISLRPRLIVCDEPVSALDVSVQGQILNLLVDLKKELNITYLFISHDLKVVRHICDRIAVMHDGEIVESGPIDTVFDNPRHELTRVLLESQLPE